MGQYYNPVETHCGVNNLQQLGSIVHQLDSSIQNILLLTRGASYHGSPEQQLITEQLKNKRVFCYDFTVSNPDITDLYQVLTDTQSFPYDLIIAVGGGSVLDVAKSCCAFHGMQVEGVDELRTAIKSKSYVANRNKVRWIGIPTTAGTGSEVTSWATIWDGARNEKHSVDSKDNYAAAAILDPTVTLNLPVRLTVTSALDAVCHATESYWSKKTNVVSRQFALTGIRHVIEHLEALIDNPTDLVLREQIMLGSFFAGLAFSNTATTACHAISYPITLNFRVDHGLAVSITLSTLMKYNESALIEKDKLYAAFGASSRDEVDAVIKRIYAKAGLSPRLRDYGIPSSDLEGLADSANNGRIDNNPIALDKQSVLSILQSVY